MELDWTEKHKNFTLNVSFLPVSPRFLDNNEFDLFYKEKTPQMKDTIFHELIHFLYFEKFKQIFPKTPKKYFEAPHLEWEMSEIVIKSIFGDKKIQKIVKFKPKIYPEHEKIIIGDNFLLNYIEHFYKNKKSFEEFIKTTWKFIQKHKDKIQEQQKG